MSTTTILRYTSCRDKDAREAIARVAAAARTTADREAREARDARRTARVAGIVTSWVEDLRAVGAVEIGFKLCDDTGKWRGVLPIEEAVRFVSYHAGEDLEVWGLTAEREHVGEVW